MSSLFFFIGGASLSGTLFLLALVELFFTMRRIKVHHELEEQVSQLKNNYTKSVTSLKAESTSKVEAVHQKVEVITRKAKEEKEAIKTEYQTKIDQLVLESEKALEKAQQKAKKLQESAKMQADDYLQSRQKEVEEELMNLVISVTKKVLPEGISYEGHKKLVLEALASVHINKTESK